MKKIYLFLFLIFLSTTLPALVQKLKEPFTHLVITNEKMEREGMFSIMNMVLGHLNYFDAGNYTFCKSISVNLKAGCYYDSSKGPNWWEYYFNSNLNTLPQKNSTTLQTTFMLNLVVRKKTRTNLTRSRAHFLIHKYIRIKDFILKKADDFYTTYFDGHYVIGVHYRGTDKNKGKKRIEYEKITQKLIALTENLTRPFKIFIGTDEEDFIYSLNSIFPGKIITTDSIRSSDTSTSIHHSNYYPYYLGEQALVDALLLSKCDYLIRTPSNLSMWSTYYNENLMNELIK